MKSIYITIAALAMMSCYSYASGQQVHAQVECICLNNQYGFTDGHFEETIIVRSKPNEIWTATEITGLYQNNSPSPPAIPIPLTSATPLQEVSPGNYHLVARRLHDSDWSLVVSNGFVSRDRQNVHRCIYAELEILGSDTVCVTDLAALELAANLIPLSDIQWTSTSGSITTSPDKMEAILATTVSSALNPEVSVVAEAPVSTFLPGNTCRVTTSKQLITDENEFCASILPVKYEYIRARSTRGSIAIDWKISESINNKGWHIQRRVGTQGWITIGWQADSDQAAYTHVDSKYTAGQINEYRLVQEDRDGHNEISYTVRAIGPEEKEVDVQLYPNPATDKITLSAKGGIDHITILNLQGQIVLTSSQSTISVADFPVGMYLVIVQTGSRQHQLSFVRQ